MLWFAQGLAARRAGQQQKLATATWLESLMSPSPQGKAGIVAAHTMRLVWLIYMYQLTLQRKAAGTGAVSAGAHARAPATRNCIQTAQVTARRVIGPDVMRGCSLGLQGGGGAGLAAVVGSRGMGYRAMIGSDEDSGAPNSNPPCWPLANQSDFLRHDLGSCLLGRWHGLSE